MQVLTALPIWALHGYGTEDLGGYSVIHPSQEGGGGKHLPPQDMDDRYIGAGFYRIRTERDRPLYQLLGVASASRGAFYAQHIIPSILERSLEVRHTPPLSLAVSPLLLYL